MFNINANQDWPLEDWDEFVYTVAYGISIFRHPSQPIYHFHPPDANDPHFAASHCIPYSPSLKGFVLIIGADELEET